MATGRTLKHWMRVYIDGYDLSGYAREIGPLSTEWDEADLTVLTDSVKGILPNHVKIGLGEFRGVFDNTATSGLHVLHSSGGTVHDVMVAIGIRAAPNYGDPAFMGKFMKKSYKAIEDGGAMLVTMPFDNWDLSDLESYQKAWGVLLHENSAATGANSTEYVDGLAATTRGGYMMYQVFAASAAGHTATIKVQHSTTTDNGDFADLGGCTSGEIDVGTAPVAGIKPTTAVTTTVNRYLRWQIALGTATSVTFALAFVRG